MAEEATAKTGIRSWVDADFFTEFWYHDEDKLRKALDVLKAEIKKRGGKINLTDIQLNPNILLTVQAAAGSLISNEFSVNMLDAIEAVLTREGVEQDAHVLAEAVLKALNNNVDLMNSGWRKPVNEFGEKLEETGFAENAYDTIVIGGQAVGATVGKGTEPYKNDAVVAEEESAAAKSGAVESAGKTEIPKPPKPASLSDVDARRWYLDAEAKIPDLIDRARPLWQQAKQAYELRNQFRAQAREAMSNRKVAQGFEITDPNLTWEQIVEKYIAKGFTGDALYNEIIKASTRSRTSINESLGIFPK